MSFYNLSDIHGSPQDWYYIAQSQYTLAKEQAFEILWRTMTST